MVKCFKIGCLGKYCFRCFEELMRKCFVCHEPVEYNDISDFSEEKGSSEEESLKEKKQICFKRKIVRKKYILKRNKKKIFKKTKKQKLT